MANDMSVRKLVELIFSNQLGNTEERAAKDSSIPTCLLANGLPRKLPVLLCMKQVIFHTEWENHIIKCCDIMFSSHTMYLKCVISTCLTESRYHENVFEAFISVCALLKFFNDTILSSNDMNFCDLNVDVFMAVYDNEIKSIFCEKGGFQQLVEHIHGHRYFLWKWTDIKSIDAAARDTILQNIVGEVEGELNRRGTLGTVDELKTMETTSDILAQKVLSTTSVELPTLPNNPALIKDLKAWNEENAEKSTRERIMKAAMGFVDFDSTSSNSKSHSETDHTMNHENNAATAIINLDVTDQKCSSSNSDSKTNQATNHNKNKPQVGKLIQGILRHYHSLFSSHANSDDNVQKKAGGNMWPF